MVDVVVTGMGAICALGSLTQAWQQLLAGRSGIRLAQPFAELPAVPLGLVGERPADLRSLLKTVVQEALADARLLPDLPETGVVIGSSRSFQAQWEDWARAEHQQDWEHTLRLTHWLETLPQQVAIATAQQVGARGPVLSPMAACATGLWAIAQGMLLLQTGQCERVIVGAVEAPITPLTLSGFRQMGALATEGCYPFDRHRQGLVLGEGAALLILETTELAHRRSAQIYGQITGFGLTADGYHVSAPQPEQTAAIRALKTCLAHSHLSPADIDYLHAHGTSTALNDAHEAELIRSLFPPSLPISSTKGAMGHTLGASGVLGAVVCLLALRDQVLPPCVGLRDPAFELNFVTTARSALLNQVLCLSFGFGGQNAAIGFRRWQPV